MASIGGIGGAPQSLVQGITYSQASAKPQVKSARPDADGDNDGTKPGQTDPKDAGKGNLIDRMA